MSAAEHDGRAHAFRHEALFYAGDDEFVECCARFVRDGVESGEAVLVVVDARKIGLLRQALDGDCDGALFADMAEVGANPARIIPVWWDFVDAHASDRRRVRGIGEPIHPGRSPAELSECQRHEGLLNVAFENGTPWLLLCPYDTESLAPEVIEEARRTHPYVSDESSCGASDAYAGTPQLAAPFDAPLPPAPPDCDELQFDAYTLRDLRRLVAERAAEGGLGRQRTADVLVAVGEAAANSVRHGGGRGTLRVWREPGVLVCEVSDAGRLDRPLAGRRRPAGDAVGGRGLWLVHQLTDLAQIRTFAHGTVVRMHMRVTAR